MIKYNKKYTNYRYREVELGYNMEHLFIINPVAGKGKAIKFIKEIKTTFQELGLEYSIKVTERPGQATEIVREYTREKDCRVYSVGGDGTLNEVLNGIVGSNSNLSIIPAGSGNDFIKSLTNNLNLQDIILRTVNGKEHLVDLAKVNDKYFINISSVGFDAEVVYKASKIKKYFGISGGLAYILGVVIKLIRYDNKFISVNIDGQLTQTRSLLTAVANGRYYGGGMLAVPDASIDDGLLDICLISYVKRSRIIRFFPKFIKGQHGDLSEVKFYRGKKVVIECEEGLTLNADGEVDKTTRAVFEIIPRAVKIIVPE